MSTQATVNKKQAFVSNMFVGILLYSVVLGFFNDYTDILKTASYSITFSMAIVMQILTYGTFAVKKVVAKKFTASEHRWSRVGLVFSVWLILFLSKFVFLFVIELVFSDLVAINGFIGILLIVACLTIVQRLAEFVYKLLGDR